MHSKQKHKKTRRLQKRNVKNTSFKYCANGAEQPKPSHMQLQKDQCPHAFQQQLSCLRNLFAEHCLPIPPRNPNNSSWESHWTCAPNDSGNTCLQSVITDAPKPPWGIFARRNSTNTFRKSRGQTTQKRFRSKSALSAAEVYAFQLQSIFRWIVSAA